MTLTITMLGAIALGVAVTIAIVLYTRRRRPGSLRPTTYLPSRPSHSRWPVRPVRQTSPRWANSEAVFFVGTNGAAADCGAGADAGSCN
jgi:hypothetical protein